MVYLLLVAGVIATPLVSDQEQLRMTGIISTIFAFLLFTTLVGFLHFAIRLFFRVSLFLCFMVMCYEVLAKMQNIIM